MRTVVYVGSEFQPKLHHGAWLRELIRKTNTTHLICSRFKPGDFWVVICSKWYQVRMARCPQHWNKPGRPAGLIRNQEMIEQADCLVLFSSGPAAEDIRRLAVEQDLLIFEWRENDKLGSN